MTDETAPAGEGWFENIDPEDLAAAVEAIATGEADAVCQRNPALHYN
jgi:hypothetical protein